MSQSTARLSLPLLMPAQAQKHVTHNEALSALDGLVQLSIEDATRSAPPPVPAEGACHLVAVPATGPWEGHDGQIARFSNGGWTFHVPQAGWRLWDRARGVFEIFDGTAWAAPAAGTDNLPGVGVNTGYDAVNRLSVASDGTLLSHEGAGHRVTVNKAAPADTASLLFQTGWSGRAEMGLAGSDGFAVKVSADGAAWAEALVADPSTGRVTLPQGARIDGVLEGDAVTQGPADTTSDRVIRTQDGYVRASVVGPVSQDQGVNTGAVIEHLTGAAGDSVTRFADGTQICAWRAAAVPANPVAWGFGHAFASTPRVTMTPVGGGPLLACAAWVNTTSAGVELYDLAGARVAGHVDCLAVGRWV